MTGGKILEWLGVRPAEWRAVALAAAGAGLVMAFFTLARALRETFFLTAFTVESLPYVTAATAITTLPAVAFFSRRLAAGRTRAVVVRLAVGLAAAILGLWPLLAGSPAAVVGFYLLTAVGALLLASGFWVLVADLFALREAKRLYGLVTAGGTAGTLAAGFSLGWLSRWLPVELLVGLPAVLLGLFVLAIRGLPRGPAPLVPERGTTLPRFPLRDALAEMARTPHLCRIAALVLTATVASTLADYLFKAQVQAARPQADMLSAFLGAFYGWTGAAALAIQLTVAPRLLSRRGIAGSLAVLPAVLMAGAAAALPVFGLWAATLLRGADNTLRRSLHRPVVEYLYVPLPPAVRRRTKTVIDTLSDTLGETLGAGLVLIALALAASPWPWLLAALILLGAIMLLLGRRMAAVYARSVTDRLHEAVSDAAASRNDPPPRDLFTASFTRMDLSFAMNDPDVAAAAETFEPDATPAPGAQASVPHDVLERLRSPDNAVAAAALAALSPDDPRQIEAAVRLLARDPLRQRVAGTLADLGERALPAVIAALRDPQTVFAVRRRLPILLAGRGGPEADAALLEALGADRFEVRYRAAAALGLRRRAGLPEAAFDWRPLVWKALAAEAARERPLWELQRLLDDREEIASDWLVRQVDVRGGLSLEHTFRLLSLVLDREAVGAAYQGIVSGDDHLRSYALEYLEQVLPADLRRRLWVHIGDVSERQRDREQRPLADVLGDLLDSRATLFPSERQQREVRRLLEDDPPDAGQDRPGSEP